jgi:hypothetical protein
MELNADIVKRKSSKPDFPCFSFSTKPARIITAYQSVVPGLRPFQHLGARKRPRRQQVLEPPSLWAGESLSLCHYFAGVLDINSCCEGSCLLLQLPPRASMS